MKKLILTVTGGLLMTIGGFGQGYVSFQNSVGTGFYFGNTAAAANKVTSAPLNQQPASGSISTGVLDVGLFWSTAPFSDFSSGTLAGIENIGPTPGLLAGNNNFAISGTSPLDNVYIQIYAWDSSFGNSQAGLEACVAAGEVFMACSAGAANTDYGLIGAPLQVSLGSSLTGTPLFGLAGNVFGKTVYPTPEPGTVVTGGLGAVAMLLLRRRQAEQDLTNRSEME